MALDLRPSYASNGDWYEWSGTTAPGSTDVSLTAELRRASRAVDRGLLTAVYDTDDDGLPTDEKVAAKLAEATCIQHNYFLETGDTAGAGEYAGVSNQRLGPETIEFLRAEGLLNAAVGSW